MVVATEAASGFNICRYLSDIMQRTKAEKLLPLKCLQRLKKTANC